VCVCVRKRERHTEKECATVSPSPLSSLPPHPPFQYPKCRRIRAYYTSWCCSPISVSQCALQYVLQCVLRCVLHCVLQCASQKVFSVRWQFLTPPPPPPPFIVFPFLTLSCFLHFFDAPSATELFAGLCVFSILGYLADARGVSIDEVVVGGPVCVCVCV